MSPIDWKKVDDKIIEAFDQMVGEFADEITFQIEDPEWEWPRETRRRNRTVVDTPRDIVDLGNLRDSQEIEKITHTHSEIQYPIEYAMPVHEGAEIITKDGDIVDLPARPFVYAALEDYDPLLNMAELLRDKLND